MPYWNRPESWAASRACYNKQYPDMDLEFSICDDGSPTPLCNTQDPRERIVYLPTKHEAKCPVTPINVAIENSTRDMIVLTNPEIEHRERVLPMMLEAWTGENDYIIAACRDSRRGEWYAGADRSMVGALAAPGYQYHFCVLFHRGLFDRAGGFDEEYREGHCYDDNDWTFRLHALGDVNVKYVPGVTTHVKAPMLRSIWSGPKMLRNEKLLRQKWGHMLCA